jgi:RNA polymerase sigma factor for flagellar operon FliA
LIPHDDDESAERRADVVSEALPILDSVARRIARRLGGHVPVDDLVSIGNSALVEIVRTWDPERARFSAYVTSRLKWAILDGVRRETHGRRTAARATALLASERLGEGYARAAAEAAPDAPPTTLEEDQQALDDLLKNSAAALAGGVWLADPDAQTAETPEEKLAHVEAAHVARELIDKMPDRERELMTRFFYGGEPLEAIAKDFGLSKSWASRLNQRAVLALRRAMGEPGEELSRVDSAND